MVTLKLVQLSKIMSFIVTLKYISENSCLHYIHLYDFLQYELNDQMNCLSTLLTNFNSRSKNN